MRNYSAYLFEVGQDAVESEVGAALIERRAEHLCDVDSAFGGDCARLGERPVVSANHRTARLVAGQVL